VNQNESGGNFLVTILDQNTTEDQLNYQIYCIQNIEKIVDLEVFKFLILELFDELISSSARSQVSLNLEKARLFGFLDVLGLDLAKELVVREIRNISQSQDHNLIENFHRSVLNYFDEKIDQKTSSFEQLKFEAFRQLSIEHNFERFVKLGKKQPHTLNRILIDLEIFRESSDGFRFVNNRDVQVFGFTKFEEILEETVGFKETFEFPGNTEIETLSKFLSLTAVVLTSEENPEDFAPELVKKSLLARNPNGKSLFHFLVDSSFKDSLMNEFLDFLKVHFGSEFVGKILKLKNNENLTFWSHAFANKDISNPKEIKFGSFLEEILKRLCGMEIDFEILKNFASHLIFGRKNFDRNFDEKFFEIGVLVKVDGKVQFSDPCFLNYFVMESFQNSLKRHYKKDGENSELWGQFLSDKEKFKEFFWLSEKFFAENLIGAKKALDQIAKIGEGNETPFFFFLGIFINQLKAGKNAETAKNLLFQKDEFKITFLHKFCWNDRTWSEESCKKLFEKFKEIKELVPENQFKEFFMLRDACGRTFLHWLEKFNSFQIAFDFLKSEFGGDFVRDFFLAGKGFFWIRRSVAELTKILSLFKNNFDLEFLKSFLMRKDGYNENFLMGYEEIYSDPENCSDLLKLFDLILSIFGTDLELFEDLFYSKSIINDQTFFEKLREKYKNKEFRFISDWIEKNLGHDFLESQINEICCKC
jgi:hypothetical protein